jgi:hypothetical protein
LIRQPGHGEAYAFKNAGLLVLTGLWCSVVFGGWLGKMGCSGVNPGNWGVGPGSCGVVPGNRGVDPGNWGVDPGNCGVVPGNCGVVPGNCGVEPGSRGVVPGNWGGKLGRDGDIFGSCGVVPGNCGVGDMLLGFCDGAAGCSGTSGLVCARQRLKGSADAAKKRVSIFINGRGFICNIGCVIYYSFHKLKPESGKMPWGVMLT